MPNVEWDGSSPEPSASVGELTLKDLICKLDLNVTLLRAEMTDLASVLAEGLPGLTSEMRELREAMGEETRRGIEKSEEVIAKMQEVLDR